EIVSTYILASIIGFLYILLMYFHGKFFFKIFRQSDESELAIVKTFIGAIVFAMIMFLLGIMRILYPVVVISYSIILLISGFVSCKLWKKKVIQGLIKSFLQSCKDQKWNYIGLLIFYILSLVFVFRPITNFDALWYHIPIPKMFLQRGNIDYVGLHLRYSVHPYINFIWNLVPLSLPGNTIFKGILINFFQHFTLLYSFFYLNKNAKSIFNWSPAILVLAPSIIGLNNATLYYLGAGYNDLYAISLSIVTIMYILKLIKKEGFISKFEYTIVTMLIAGLFLLKIFFGIFAFIVYIYFICKTFNKLFYPNKIKNKVFDIIRLNFILFCTLILPWVIRSYVFTGRLLDPIGMPGLNQDAYEFAGSNSAAFHWSTFVWDRFYDNLPKIFIQRYNPIMLFGLLAAFSIKMREKYLDLWLLGLFGLFSVYFISIVTEWRYFYGSVSIIMILGLTLISRLTSSINSVFSKLILLSIPTLFLGFILLSAFVSNGDINRDLYLIKFQSQDEFISSRNGTFVFDYYMSENSPRPDNLSSTEKIFVGNVHNTGYIENPILEPRVDYTKFKDLEDAEAFANIIKANNVRYMLVKRITLGNLCKMSGVLDYNSCQIDGNEYWEEVVHDKTQQATWFKLK
ncbi:MAG: hypothetical protein AAGF07_04680, partial [Patescibacteria group bacterium]